MASYHIWHPTYVSAEPVTLDAFVTEGEGSFLRTGSDELVRAALDAMGISASAAKWSLVPMRAAYFSSYRASGEAWEDQWQLVWRLRAELDASPPLPAVPGHGYVDLEASDKSFRRDDKVDGWPSWPCLVLADAQDLAAVARMRAIVEAAVPEARIVLGQAFDRWPQLRCDLGKRPAAYYAEGAGEAEDLMKALAAEGAAVDYKTSRARG